MPMLAQRITTLLTGGPWVDLDRDSRAFQLELFDGSVIVPFDTPDQFVMPGFTGFGLAPRTVVTDTTPGIDGGWLREITIQERRIFLPFFIGSDAGHLAYLRMLADLRRAVSLNGHTAASLRANSGHLNLVVKSVLGERVLAVAYVDGLEGDESTGAAGSSWATYGINLLAVDPYWRDRNLTIQSYSTTSAGVFLGDGLGAPPPDNPWPRRLSSSSVIGSDMVIQIDSDVPVAPDIEVLGPATSMSYDADSGAAFTYDDAIADESVLTIATGRVKSAKIDGASVWGNMSLAASMQPLQPGPNVVNVALAGATSDSRLRVVYRKGWESAW